jgi:hypothetical protein
MNDENKKSNLEKFPALPSIPTQDMLADDPSTHFCIIVFIDHRSSINQPNNQPSKNSRPNDLCPTLPKALPDLASSPPM